MECITDPEIELELKTFEVILHIVAIYLKRPSKDSSEYQIQVQCLNEKIVPSMENDVVLGLENNTLLNYFLNITYNTFASVLTPEQYMFQFFSNPLIIQLVKTNNLSDFQSIKNKSKKTIQNVPSAAYIGQINAFECLITNQTSGDVSELILINVDGQSLQEEVTLHYTIEFCNPPEIYNIFSMMVSNILNFPNNDNNHKIEIGFHLPLLENNYELIYLHDLTTNTPKNNSGLTGLHYDSYLKSIEFQIANELTTHLSCQNYLTQSNVNLLKKLNEECLKILIEIKITNVSGPQNHYMAMLDMGIFNYEGVQRIKYVLPIYEFNANYVKEHFNIEVVLYPEDLMATKDKNKKKSNKVETKVSSLVPFTLNGNQIAMVVEFQLAHPFYNEPSLDQWKELLNHEIPFLDKRSDQEKALNEAKKFFATTVLKISEGLEDLINVNQHLEHHDLHNKINFFVENDPIIMNGDLNKSIKMLISNQFNIETKTQSNHEFKILMIKVYEMLTLESSIILQQKTTRDNSNMIHCLREQTWFYAEECLLMENSQMGEKLFTNLSSEMDENTMIDYSIFCIKRKDYEKCKEVALKLLQKDSNSVFAFYILSYLMFMLRKNEVVVMLLKIMLKLLPDNLELWILLKMTCEQLNDTNGVDVCCIKIDELKSETLKHDFCELQNTRKPLSWIELKTSNPVYFIINRQLKMGLLKYSSLIMKYLLNTQPYLEDNFDLKYLQLIELMIQEDHDNGLKQLQCMVMNDDTEIMLRYAKGNLLYSAGDFSKAICEYEIAYNINMKSSEDNFLHMPTMRCGKAYLFNFLSTAKAKKYYHSCCKYYPTFNSWIGLGLACKKETDFNSAEKFNSKSQDILNSYGIYYHN